MQKIVVPFNKQVTGGSQLINEVPAFGMAHHKPSARPKHACRIAARSRLVRDVAVHAIHKDSVHAGRGQSQRHDVGVKSTDCRILVLHTLQHLFRHIASQDSGRLVGLNQRDQDPDSCPHIQGHRSRTQFC